MNTKYYLTAFIVAALMILAGSFAYLDRKPSPLDEFAVCLKDEGAVFYGAFWCKFCQSQKRMFGASAKKLPYVECSTPDGKSQLPFCKEKGITGYPTWEFADGTRESGAIPLPTLAEKTGCILPTTSS